MVKFGDILALRIKELEAEIRGHTNAAISKNGAVIELKKLIKEV